MSVILVEYRCRGTERMRRENGDVQKPTAYLIITYRALQTHVSFFSPDKVG